MDRVREEYLVAVIEGEAVDAKWNKLPLLDQLYSRKVFESCEGDRKCAVRKLRRDWEEKSEDALIIGLFGLL